MRRRSGASWPSCSPAFCGGLDVFYGSFSTEISGFSTGTYAVFHRRRLGKEPESGPEQTVRTKDEIRQGNAPGDDQHIDKYLEINERYSQPVSPETDPQSSANNGGVEIKTFIPTECGRSNLNNHSMVTVLKFAESKIILPGDNESASWKELLEDSDFRAAISGADILLAPHHGREAGFYNELFDHFKPRLTIISDGPSETSAVDKYSGVSSGWVVHKRSGGKEERKCVTTRSDGVIVVKFGFNNGTKPFIAVYVD